MYKVLKYKEIDLNRVLQVGDLVDIRGEAAKKLLAEGVLEVYERPLDKTARVKSEANLAERRAAAPPKDGAANTGTKQ